MKVTPVLMILDALAWSRCDRAGSPAPGQRWHAGSRQHVAGDAGARHAPAVDDVVPVLQSIGDRARLRVRAYGTKRSTGSVAPLTHAAPNCVPSGSPDAIIAASRSARSGGSSLCSAPKNAYDRAVTKV